MIMKNQLSFAINYHTYLQKTASRQAFEADDFQACCARPSLWCSVTGSRWNPVGGSPERPPPALGLVGGSKTPGGVHISVPVGTVRAVRASWIGGVLAAAASAPSG